MTARLDPNYTVRLPNNLQVGRQVDFVLQIGAMQYLIVNTPSWELRMHLLRRLNPEVWITA